MRSISLLCFIVAGLICDFSEGQLFRRFRQVRTYEVIQSTMTPCPTGDCAPVVNYVEALPAVQEVDSDAIVVVDDWGRTAARFLVGNSCGSGSLCGFYKDGTLFLTNAHVTGTRPGTEAKIRMVVGAETKEYMGRVVMAAYSDKTLTDWSVVYVEEKIDVVPRYLAKTKPTGSHTTVGSPKCVWPLQRQNITTADVSENSALWRWRPNSIGGQSGSGVWSLSDGLQYGLLTWSWGGLGAGQQTSEIYRQARQKSVSGEPRIDGLVELGRNRDVIVENGFYQESGIDELPIWKTEPDDEPAPPTPPKPDCDDLDDTERGLLARLKDRAKERGIDWILLIQIILQLLEMFKK